MRMVQLLGYREHKAVGEKPRGILNDLASVLSWTIKDVICVHLTLRFYS